MSESSSNHNHHDDVGDGGTKPPNQVPRQVSSEVELQETNEAIRAQSRVILDLTALSSEFTLEEAQEDHHHHDDDNGVDPFASSSKKKERKMTAQVEREGSTCQEKSPTASKETKESSSSSPSKSSGTHANLSPSQIPVGAVAIRRGTSMPLTSSCESTTMMLLTEGHDNLHCPEEDDDDSVERTNAAATATTTKQVDMDHDAINHATLPFQPHVEAKAISTEELEDALKEEIFRNVVVAEIQKESTTTSTTTATTPNDPSSNQSMMRNIFCWIAAISIVAVVAVTVSVVVTTLGDDENDDGLLYLPTTYPPTPSPTLSSAQMAVKEFLQASFPPGAASLDNPSSPQHEAMLWLADHHYTDGSVPSPTTTVLQTYAMFTLYFAWNGPEWIRQDGWLDVDVVDFCQREATPGSGWELFGVSCLGTDKVAELILPSNNIRGSGDILELQLLDRLKVLELNGNQLEGPIDDFLSNIVDSRMHTLQISSNSFTGTLPSSIMGQFSRLKTFDIQSNPITGSLPTEMGHMTDMTDFSIEACLFNGSIPSELGQWRRLEVWNSRDVVFTGSLPTEVGKLSELKHLEIAGAYMMAGTIPEGLYDLTKLTSLQMTRVGFQGPISTSIGNLRSLARLELGFQNLEGSIPTEIGLATSLEFLRLDTNFFTGTLPAELGLLTNLKAFTPRDNYLTGTIPTEIANIPTLTNFVFSYNPLSGSLPSEIGQMTNLGILNGDSCQLTGTVPSEMYALSTIKIFSLADNALSGTLPQDAPLYSDTLESFGLGSKLSGSIPPGLFVKAQNLGRLVLAVNELTGTIPSEIGLLPKLDVLGLSDNLLTGRLPVELANCTELERIDVQRNALTGTIPKVFASSWPSINQAFFQGNNFDSGMATLEPFCGLDQLFADCDNVACPCCTFCCQEENNDGSGCTWTGQGLDKEEESISTLRRRRTRAPGNRTIASG